MCCNWCNHSWFTSFLLPSIDPNLWRKLYAIQGYSNTRKSQSGDLQIYPCLASSWTPIIFSICSNQQGASPIIPGWWGGIVDDFLLYIRLCSLRWNGLSCCYFTFSSIAVTGGNDASFIEANNFFLCGSFSAEIAWRNHWCFDWLSSLMVSFWSRTHASIMVSCFHRRIHDQFLLGTPHGKLHIKAFSCKDLLPFCNKFWVGNMMAFKKSKFNMRHLRIWRIICLMRTLQARMAGE